MLSESDVARITFGCGNFGGIGSSPALRAAGDSEEHALSLLDYARQVGIKRFDTANTYGGGASEIILGKWLRSQGASFLQEVQIATKVGNPHGCPLGEAPLSTAQITQHLDESLRRLGVDRVDLYYIHEFDRVTALEETLAAFEGALEAGKIDRFGVSNASLTDVAAVKSLAGAKLAAHFEYVQNEYNLLARSDEEELIPYCAEHGLRFIAYSPLAGGLLTGKYQLGEEPPQDSRLARAGQIYSAYLNEQCFAVIEQLREDAERLRQPVAEAALRFVLEKPGVNGLIVAPRRTQHFTDMGFAPQTMVGGDGLEPPTLSV